MGDGICATSAFRPRTRTTRSGRRARRFGSSRSSGTTRATSSRPGRSALRRPRRHRHRPTAVGVGGARSPDGRVRRHDERRGPPPGDCGSRDDRGRRRVRAAARASLRLETLGEAPVTAASEPVPPSPRRASVRTIAEDGRPLAPLVGRERELDGLRASAEGLHAGRGRSCFSSASRASGSPLLEALRTIVGDAPPGSRAVPLLRRASVRPFDEILRGWLAIGEASRRSRLVRGPGKLGALLGSRLGDVFPPFGGLLRLRLPRNSKPESGDEAAAQASRPRLWVTALAGTGRS